MKHLRTEKLEPKGLRASPLKPCTFVFTFEAKNGQEVEAVVTFKTDHTPEGFHAYVEASQEFCSWLESLDEGANDD